MAKDKVKVDTESEGFTDAVGTPTAMLLPARNYKFRVFDDNYSITVPRKGVYAELDGAFSEDDGKFNLLEYNKEDRSHVLYIPALSKILFATSQYPDLADNQAFTPIAIIFRRNEVEIVGNIIEMVHKEN